MSARATEQLRRLTDGIAELLSEEELLQKLETSEREGRPMRVKAGFDPSCPDMHLGHTVLLNKLRQFQEYGHTVVYIIGDATARVGDPSGRNQTRPVLSDEQIRENARTYQTQAFKVLDPRKTETVYNNEWFGRMSFADMMTLSAHVTVSQILQRDDFQKRLSTGGAVSLLEIFYPLMQAYDSVRVRCDVECGGTDQKFNLLMGRQLQKEYGQSPQCVLLMPLLVGLDGQNKMSKSLGNHVAIEDGPVEMFGKLMSVSDEMMIDYYSLLTDLAGARIREDIGSGKLHPKTAKEDLASRVVERFHGQDSAREAREGFCRVFSKHETPAEIPHHTFGEREVGVLKALTVTGLAESGNEARRLVKQNAVTVDGKPVSSPDEKIALTQTPRILKAGKRKFAGLRAA
ncbi:MAG: tyrosine--tRNA ligase [Candidatus Omnitrophica bacterium]|nr:tyrosine--tRNA ligase [Candidatus Omnitrophota bacterium]